MSKKPFTSKSKASSKGASTVGPKQRQPDQLLKLIGAQIRAVRNDRGLSGDDLAHSIPLDRAHLGLIETGKIAPNIKTLVKIAVALECEVGDLIPYVEDLLPHADWLEG